MSFSTTNFDDPDAAWGALPDLPERDIIKETLQKEQTIKDIVAAKEDLRALLTKVKTTQADVDKLTSGNATLQMYIDNLTMQMAKRR